MEDNINITNSTIDDVKYEYKEKSIFGTVLGKISNVFGGLDYQQDMKNEKTEKESESDEQFEYLHDVSYNDTDLKNIENWNKRGKDGWEMVQRSLDSTGNNFEVTKIIWKRKLKKKFDYKIEGQQFPHIKPIGNAELDIYSFRNLADWLITNKRSIFLESDISLEDKKKICYALNISTIILE